MRNPYEVISEKEKQIREKSDEVERLKNEVEAIHVVLPMLHEPSDVFGLTAVAPLSNSLTTAPVSLASVAQPSGWDSTTKRWP